HSGQYEEIRRGSWWSRRAPGRFARERTASGTLAAAGPFSGRPVGRPPRFGRGERGSNPRPRAEQDSWAWAIARATSAYASTPALWRADGPARSLGAVSGGTLGRIGRGTARRVERPGTGPDRARRAAPSPTPADRAVGRCRNGRST